MKNTTALTLLHTCTCTAPGDTCPACYQQSRRQLQEELWEASLKLADLQQQALELERRRRR